MCQGPLNRRCFLKDYSFNLNARIISTPKLNKISFCNVALHVHDGATDFKRHLLEAVQWHQLRKNIHLETSARNSRRFGNV